MNDEPLLLEALCDEREGRGLFRVYQPFSFTTSWGFVVVVPAGYVTDLCSVPSFARAWVPTSGRVSKAAVLHDWLLDQGCSEAHRVFNEALEVAGVKPTTRRILVTAVRLWAWYRRFQRA
ncbi:DUF1353 domain-containing protein [Sphingomonas jaspsi]|uniref:DUF1353 domain-containing protein n=1 Tax=Sphingomonas jaspsi TaxID=392409 RepID=UPI0004B0C594|nr:DUF1353 domain-containing protein [Sphingomonas jaspsi]